MRVLVLGLVLLLSSVAHAEEFGGWKYTPPAGATTSVEKSVVKLTTIDNTAKTFCQVWLYSVRPPTGDDFNKEWNDLVVRPFTIRGASDLVNAKIKDITVTARNLTIMNGDDAYAAAFYVLQPQGAVSSVMLISTNQASIAKCPMGAFLESLVLEKPPAPAPAAPATAPAPAAESGAPSIAGTWSNGSSHYVGGVSQGAVKSRYTLNPDGSYQFFRETWGGSGNPTWYFTVLETGAWKLDGDQLTLTPKKSTGTEHHTDKKTQRPVKVPLESATYTARTVYMSGLQQWNLVLTIAKPTTRDGAFASNSSYPSSYLFHNKNIEFRYGPK